MKYLTVFVLLLALCGLNACQWGTPPPSPASDAVRDAACSSDRVIIRFGVQEGQASVYQPLVETFNTHTSDMCVLLVPLGGSGPPVVNSTEEVIAIVRQADVVELFRNQLNAQTEGLFLNLGPLLEADAAFDITDYFPNALEFIGPEQRVYMLPRTLNPQILAYNQDLWTAHGLPTPDATWTWVDVLEAAEQLTTRVGGTTTVYGLSDINNGLTTALFFLDAQGVDFVALPATDIDLTQPTYVAAVERVAALANAGVLHLDRSDPKFLQQIRTGQIAIWWSWHDWTTQTLEQESDNLPFTIGVIPFPQFDSYVRNNSSGYLINRATQHPTHAWRWLAFLSKQSIPPITGRWDRTMYPTRRSIVAQGGGWEAHPPAVQTAQAAMAERPRQAATALDYTYDQLVPLRDVLTQVVNADVAVPQVLREAQEHLQQQIAEVNRIPTVVVEPVPVNTPVVANEPPGATSIVFATSAIDDPRLHALIDQFHTDHPSVFVQLTRSASTASSRDLAQQADCFITHGPVPRDAAVHFLDLQPLLDADPTFPHDDYLPGLLTNRYQPDPLPDQPQPGLYVLPYELILRTLVYQPGLFDQAGLAYPTSDWTLTDLFYAAERLTAASNARYGFASTEPLRDLPYVLAQSEAQLTQGQGTTLEPTFTAPTTRNALRQYIELLRQFGPPLPQAARSDTNPVAEAIMSGQVALWLDDSRGRFPVMTVQQRYDFPISLAAPPFPAQPPTANDVTISQGLAIAAQTPRREACWQWIQYLSSEPVFISSDWPARASLAESEAFQQQATAGAAAVYRAYQQASTSQAVPAQPSLEVTSFNPYWFNQAMYRALQGAALEQVLQEAQTTTLQHLDCVRTGGEPDECARQVDPDYKDNRDQPPGID